MISTSVVHPRGGPRYVLVVVTGHTQLGTVYHRYLSDGPSQLNKGQGPKWVSRGGGIYYYIDETALSAWLCTPGEVQGAC